MGSSIMVTPKIWPGCRELQTPSLLHQCAQGRERSQLLQRRPRTQGQLQPIPKKTWDSALGSGLRRQAEVLAGSGNSLLSGCPLASELLPDSVLSSGNRGGQVLEECTNLEGRSV